MNNTGKILTAAAAGIAAGAVLGILFAPDKGCETRKKISDQGKKITDGVKNTFNKEKEKLNNLKESMIQKVNDKIEELV
jgi:gas vesicle protein